MCKKHKRDFIHSCPKCDQENFEGIMYEAGATRRACANVFSHQLVQNNLEAAKDLLNRFGHAPITQTQSDNKIEIIIRDLKAERNANKSA